MGASLTLLPILVKQYRGVITLGGFTLSLELLLLAACLFSGGDWFLLASAGVLLGLGAAFLPGALRELPRPLGEPTAVLSLGTETLLPWAWVLICRYAPISRWWKGTACLGAACVFLPLVNPVIDRLVRLGGGTVERLHGFWFRPDFTRWAENWYFNENVLLLLWLALAAAAALCALRALLRRRAA